MIPGFWRLLLSSNPIAMNLFNSICDHDPDSTAIVFNKSELTYGALREATLKMAGAIDELGVRRGDRVALLLNDSPEFVEAFLAISGLGAIVVPINMALSIEDQCSILHNCGARVVVIESDHCNRLLTGAVEKLHAIEYLAVVARDGNDFEVRTDTLPQLEVVSLYQILANVTKLHSLSDSDPNAPAFLLYTSGSTGEPKGAVHTQAHAFYTNESFCREVLRVTPTDRLFSSSRLPFAYGLGNSFSFPLLNGATTILCNDKPTPPIIASILREQRPTIFFGVPVIYNLLLEYHRQQSPLDCSSLRLCVSAGEALPAHLGEEWQREFGVEVLDGIGSTEMLHMFMSNYSGALRYGSSGKVLPGYEARLTDPAGIPAADLTEGDLWIKGESAALSYWEKPGESARTFVDGWVRTGDIYRRDAEGYWYHMGRSDDCFKSSGQWVSPVEVEGVLSRHAEVARVAVVEAFDEHNLSCPCAFVVRHKVESDSSALELELREFARASLPRFKQPRKYVFVPELPYTATGKVQRFKLREKRQQ